MPVGRSFLDTYDLLLLAVGGALLLATMGADFLRRNNINTSFLYLGVGLLAGPLLLDLGPENPLSATPVLERVAEFAVIASLLVLGIRIGRPLRWKAWRSTARLILIVMPVTIVAVALSGHFVLGLALGPALLLGAILAPTDPILAGPLEESSLEDEDEGRFGLSSEAGLNDGFAFPFIYLGINLTVAPMAWGEWLPLWFLRDFVYAIGIALPAGWIWGTLCGRLYLRERRRKHVTRTRFTFIPVALLLASYGFTEAMGGYGFLAAFSTGLAFRRMLQSDPDALRRFAIFVEALDEFIKAGLLIMLGGLLRWSPLAEVGWPLLGFSLLLIFLLRPSITLLVTAKGDFSRHDRAYWSWFGIRGIGSIYYMSYALTAGTLDPAVSIPLFTIATATILVSIIVHGLSVYPYMRKFADGRKVEA